MWALALGTFLNFVLTEGLARWQLATGATLLEGWARHPVPPSPESGRQTIPTTHLTETGVAL